MTKSKNVTLRPPGFLLSEEGHTLLEQMRNQWFLMTRLIFAAILKEEHMLPEFRRSLLGELLESFGWRMDDVSNGMEWVQPRKDLSQGH